MSTTIDALNKRFAVGKFDTEKHVSDEQIMLLKQALVLTPNSMNLQPWKFIFIKDKELLKKIYDENACHQEQVITCDLLIVMCLRTDINSGYVDKWMKKMAEIDGKPRESFEGYEKMISGFAEYSSEEAKEKFARDMVMVAEGNLLTVCAMEGIGAGPMGGYDAGKMDEILGLADKNLKSVVLCAIGVKASNLPDHGKRRWELEDVIIDL